MVSFLYILRCAPLSLPSLSTSLYPSYFLLFDALLTGKDFSAVNWTAFADTIPAMFALTFFGVLHVPINVPALGISTGEDNLNVDRELMAHGVTNVLSGLTGSIQVCHYRTRK